jgi:hypothetical protein
MALTPDEQLAYGIDEMRGRSKNDERWRYVNGVHDLPYAPEGVSDEYYSLREQAGLPLVQLAIKLPVQRLRVGGLRSDNQSPSDDATWTVWQKNRLSSRSRVLYQHAIGLGHGIVSVWRGEEHAVINVEDPARVYLHLSEYDANKIEFAVKVWVDDETDVAMLYTASRFYRYESPLDENDWTLVDSTRNPLGRVPFVMFAPEQQADGLCHSKVDSLIPMQRAIDTMRFNLMLAAQFAAFRQRIVVGYDPVARDVDGQIVYKADKDGNQVLDSNGMPIPIINKPGRAGVDRLLVFPGEATKVFDLQESNLTYYTEALGHLIQSFAAIAQVPSQYLVGDFKNVSGDLMAATEATLRGYVAELQTIFGDYWNEVFEMASEVQGEEYATFPIWMDAEPKSISEIADAASKMVPNGAPIRLFLEMMPGADQTQVNSWMKQGRDALQQKIQDELGQFGNEVA